MKTEQQLENQKMIEKLKIENALMKRLSTGVGFFKSYFEFLKDSQTKEQAFNRVNDLYCELFGQKRYINFVSFSKMHSLVK